MVLGFIARVEYSVCDGHSYFGAVSPPEGRRGGRIEPVPVGSYGEGAK